MMRGRPRLVEPHSFEDALAVVAEHDADEELAVGERARVHFDDLALYRLWHAGLHRGDGAQIAEILVRAREVKE